MGLQLTISLDKTIQEIDGFFDELKFKAITIAARQGINRAAKRTRSMAIKELRKRRKAKLSEFKKGFVTMKSAKGMNIARLEAQVRFSGVPLPLIFFILGDKKPKVQTVRNARRRSRRFEIIKGRKSTRAGLFVQKAKRGRQRYQVFRRTDPSDKSKGFKSQSTPSVAHILRSKRALLNKIENRALRLMQVEVSRALAFQLSKLKL